jgi:REP element-mobilizing transposase RayT
VKDGVPERKANRLATYNYSQSGVYFITICSKNKRCTFGTIVGGGVPDAPRIRLSPTGKIVARQLGNMIAFYPHVRIEKYVVMPNHIHLLIAIQQGPSGASRTPPPTSARASQVIPMFISILKRLTNKTAGHALWQRGYYDHIIRSPDDYNTIWHYIDTNPANGRRIHVMSRTFLIRCGGPAAAPTKR